MVEYTFTDSHDHAKKMIQKGKNAWGKFIIGLLVIPFTFCVDILIALAKLFKMSYRQISVILNLYIQGAILALSSLIPVICYGYYMYHSITFIHIVIFCLWVLYFILYLVFYVSIIKRYPFPLSQSFEQCSTDLQLLAHKLRIPYMFLNLFLFVVIWLGVIALNVVIGHMILTIL